MTVRILFIDPCFARLFGSFLGTVTANVALLLFFGRKVTEFFRERVCDLDFDRTALAPTPDATRSRSADTRRTALASLGESSESVSVDAGEGESESSSSSASPSSLSCRSSLGSSESVQVPGPATRDNGLGLGAAPALKTLENVKVVGETTFDEDDRLRDLSLAMLVSFSFSFSFSVAAPAPFEPSSLLCALPPLSESESSSAPSPTWRRLPLLVLLTGKELVLSLKPGDGVDTESRLNDDIVLTFAGGGRNVALEERRAKIEAGGCGAREVGDGACRDATGL